MTTLADDLVPDALWALVEPLLPTPSRQPYGARRRGIPDRRPAWAHGLVAWSAALGGWLVVGGLGSEGGGVLGDQGAEALQQLQQQGELLVGVAGR